MWKVTDARSRLIHIRIRFTERDMSSFSEPTFTVFIRFVLAPTGYHIDKYSCHTEKFQRTTLVGLFWLTKFHRKTETSHPQICRINLTYNMHLYDFIIIPYCVIIYNNYNLRSTHEGAQDESENVFI